MLRAMIVDDEPDMLEFLNRALRGRYQVDAFRVATQAEMSLKSAHYHLLITDHRMPGLSGLALLEGLGDGYPKLARVLLSGESDIERVKQALAAGIVDAYVLKPVDGDTLLAAAHEAEARRGSAGDSA
jgi:DNA-binding NtrC family response regulator